jgi:hypothetical protein
LTAPTPEPTTPAPVSPASPTLTPPAATTTTTSTPAPAPPAAPAATGGSLSTAVLSGAVVAAALSGWVTAALARRSTRLEERARVRKTLAEAYQAYADYKEFPYAIRRRRKDEPGEERIRLSEEMRRVQSRLSYYQAWTLAESPETGTAYNDLVNQLRRVAGASMREAWKEPPLDDDEGMNIGPDRVDLGALKAAEQRFLKAAETHVAAITKPWWRRGTQPERPGGQPGRPGDPAPETAPRDGSANGPA